MEGERRNPTLWIVLGIVLIVACCAVLVVALAYAFFSASRAEQGLIGPTLEEEVTRQFDASSAPRLVVDNFAGDIIVRVSDENVIEVRATKKVRRQADLERISVSMEATEDGVRIETSRSAIETSNVSVDLDIQVPAGTTIDVKSGAGRVEISGVSGNMKIRTGAGDVVVRDAGGEVEATTGAGSVEVSGGTGRVELNTGAGTVSYKGSPRGDYRLETGAGSIQITLPSDASVELDLTTGIGDIDVAFEVQGQVSRREVKGMIGSGEQATIRAHTGTGSIDVAEE